MNVHFCLLLFAAHTSEYADLKRNAPPQDPDWNFIPLPFSNQEPEIAKSDCQPVYKSFLDNVRCNDGRPLWQGKVRLAGECRARCSIDPGCHFYAFWKQRKYCETYKSCFSTSEDGKNVITLYKKLSECDQMLEPYMKIISVELYGYVFDQGPNRNIACTCEAARWIICGIFATPGMGVDAIVRTRLDKQANPDYLKPFQVIRSSNEVNFSVVVLVSPVTPTVIEPSGRVRPPIAAEINILSPTRCAELTLCIEGTPAQPQLGSLPGSCPFKQHLFKSGDPVYILNSQVDDFVARRPVPCISAYGLRSWSTDNHGDYFIDPFERENLRFMLVTKDYTLFFIFDEATIESGLCKDLASSDLTPLPDDPGEPSAQQSKKARKRRAKKQSAAEASEPPPAAAAAAEEPEPLSPSDREESPKREEEAPKIISAEKSEALTIPSASSEGAGSSGTSLNVAPENFESGEWQSVSRKSRGKKKSGTQPSSGPPLSSKAQGKQSKPQEQIPPSQPVSDKAKGKQPMTVESLPKVTPLELLVKPLTSGPLPAGLEFMDTAEDFSELKKKAIPIKDAIPASPLQEPSRDAAEMSRKSYTAAVDPLPEIGALQIADPTTPQDLPKKKILPKVREFFRLADQLQQSRGSETASEGVQVRPDTADASTSTEETDISPSMQRGPLVKQLRKPPLKSPPPRRRRNPPEEHVATSQSTFSKYLPVFTFIFFVISSFYILFIFSQPSKDDMYVEFQTLEEQIY